jgi:hypothetical protein
MQLRQGSASEKDPDAPYLSVVVTARNDDHGGNLLRRMQVFVDAWINQSKRHNLPSELIVVEWNPPAERERLVTALRWPAETGPCQVRIIEVPAEVHSQYRHAAALPLYQMIAKNVGIRRARGEFILATNIDIVFSDELMEFLARRRLEQGKMYRIDRTDVMSDVPVEGTLDEQLAYCSNNLIRVFAREGAFPLIPDGLRRLQADDIARPESGIHFADGWFAVEKWDRPEPFSPAEPFRWIGNEAEILVRVPDGGAVLEMELEAGPGVEGTPGILQVIDKRGVSVGAADIVGRTRVGLVMPAPHNRDAQLVRFRVPNGGLPVMNEQRILNFRVFRCDWARPEDTSARPPALPIRHAYPTLGRLLSGFRTMNSFLRTLLRGPGLCLQALRLLKARGEDIYDADMEFWIGPGWSYLEHVGFERYRWVAKDAQLTLRIRNAQRAVGMLVEPGPAVGYKPFVFVVRLPDGRVLTRARIHGLTYLEFTVPAGNGELVTLFSTAEGGGTPLRGDGRDLYFRVLACGAGAETGAIESDTQPEVAAPCTTPYAILTLASGLPVNAVQPAALRKEIADMGKPPFLHTYACGDFTLMSREHWFELRGYAELDRFSMHLDSLLCYSAQYAGAEEQVLRAPLRIYHIEHGIGSGWTPEGQERLNTRIAQKGIHSIPHDDVLWLIAQMRARHAPVVFNMDDWGLVNLELPETIPSAVVSASRGV